MEEATPNPHSHSNPTPNHLVEGERDGGGLHHAEEEEGVVRGEELVGDMGRYGEIWGDLGRRRRSTRGRTGKGVRARARARARARRVRARARARARRVRVRGQG